MLGMKKVLSTSVGLALTLAVGAGALTPAVANTATAPSESEIVSPMEGGSTLDHANKEQVIEVFNEINKFRATKGLKPVRFNATVTELSEDWSEQMATEKAFYHNPNYAKDPRVVNRWTAAGEIIAARWDTSGLGLVNQWIASPSHNSIMSDPRLEVVGVGIHKTGNTDFRNDPNNYTMFGTVNFFTFNPGAEPTGAYTTAQDYYDGKLSNDPPPATTVTPTGPTWNNATGEYTIPSQTGVDYYVNDVLTPAGTYASGWTTISVTARPKSGYKLNGTVFWSHTFTKPATAVTPTAPVFDNATMRVTIPSKTGVNYMLNGSIVGAGTYRGSGTVEVTAIPQRDYTLTGTSRWVHTFVATPAPEPTPEEVAVTPKAPTFTTTTYTIPSSTGVTYVVNGNTVAGSGTYTGTPSANIKIEATPNPGYRISGTSIWSHTFAAKPAPTPVSNPSIKTKGDLVAFDKYGTLWNYGMLNSSRVKIGSGWGVMKSIKVADWNSDGVQDIVAIAKTGQLYVYLGKTTGSFNRILIGNGWQSYDIDAIKWKSTDKFPSIVAKNTISGEVFHYGNPSGSKLSSRTKIGAGWKYINLHTLDWDKDGRMDVVAQFSNGQMKLYRTDGNGRFVNESRKVIGNGWQGFNAIIAIDGLKGASTPGLLVRDRVGGLYYYGTSTSKWISRTKVGAGWNGYVIAGQ